MTTRRQFEMDIDRDVPLTLSLEVELDSGCPPRFSDVDGGDPGEGPSMTVLSCSDQDGNQVELTEDEEDMAFERACEQ